MRCTKGDFMLRFRLKLSAMGMGVLMCAVIVRGQSQTQAAGTPAHALGNLSDALLEWPLAPGEESYAAINSKHIHSYVVEQAAVSRRYRDQGHPKFWGRIIGTSGDAESAEWLAAKFKAIGMADVHIQPFDLAPQWMPESWEVSISSGDKILHLDSAQPDYGSASTSPEGLDVEAVYAGLGSEADFAGKDVHGKA